MNPLRNDFDENEFVDFSKSWSQRQKEEERAIAIGFAIGCLMVLIITLSLYAI